MWRKTSRYVLTLSVDAQYQVCYFAVQYGSGPRFHPKNFLSLLRYQGKIDICLHILSPDPIYKKLIRIRYTDKLIYVRLYYQSIQKSTWSSCTVRIRAPDPPKKIPRSQVRYRNLKILCWYLSVFSTVRPIQFKSDHFPFTIPM